MTTVTAAAHTAVDALHHYRNTPDPTNTDRVAADTAVRVYAQTAGLEVRAAVFIITRTVLRREREDRDVAVAEALAADRR